MSRNVAVTLCVFVALFISPLAIAQAPDFAGTWAGAMATDAGPGGLEITLMRDGATWKATAKMRLEGQEVATPVKELKIDGADISLPVSR